MLNKDDIKQYRLLRGLSYREVSNYCNVSHTIISQIEKGERNLTLETHNEIVNGINLAYDAKCKGTLKAENTRKPKVDTNKQLTANLPQAKNEDVPDSAQAEKSDTPNLAEVQNNRTDSETKPKRTTKRKTTKSTN